MLISELNQLHLEKVCRIEQICFSHPWTEASLLEELCSEHTICMGAREKGRLVGYCFFSVVLDEGTLLQIAVLPEYRNRGIGKQLVRSALERAEKMGVCSALLEVRTGNLPAKRLYQSLGFTEIALRKGYYRDGEDAAVMQKTL